MPKIYTSYFANWRKFPKGAVPISIATYYPSGFNGKSYPKLAPSVSLRDAYKHNEITWNVFESRFQTEVLSCLKHEIVLEDLFNLSGGKNILLLCWEKDFNRCHRNITARWLRSVDYPIYVEEL